MTTPEELRDQADDLEDKQKSEKKAKERSEAWQLFLARFIPIAVFVLTIICVCQCSSVKW